MLNATVILHWPGKSTAMCDVHHEKANGIAKAMGMPVVSFSKIDVNEPHPPVCKNCQNEHEKFERENTGYE